MLETSQVLRLCVLFFFFSPLLLSQVQIDLRSESRNFGGGRLHPKTASSADVVQATTVQGC